MADRAPLSFANLRSWDGSQARAFEELTYQLLKTDVPNGTRAIRTGNPDGGVEWYAALSDGSEYGWQAKYITNIDSLLTAMTDSVRRVCLERPQLRRLTFVVSMDLATGTSGNKQKSQRQKYEDRITHWRQTIAGAETIGFELIGKSDLLALLAEPRHAGRTYFWWGQTVLDAGWLRSRYATQRAAANDKYRPDLQVDIPIQDDLLALGFDASIREQFETRRRRLLSQLEDLRPTAAIDTPLEPFYGAINSERASLEIAATNVRCTVDDVSASLVALKLSMEHFKRVVWDAIEEERKLHEPWSYLEKNDPARGPEPSRRAQDWDIRHVLSAIEELEDWLGSSAGKAWLSKAYFLSGQAGSGKTHLFLDATLKALDAGRPAVFLTGAAFQPGGPWVSIAEQLGLGTIGTDELLGAMDSAAEASSEEGARFLLLIDAINETRIDNFWHEQLPQIRAALARHPHVALAVSCRDTYVDVVIDDSERRHYLSRKHPGFAGSEVEATQRYFDHYGLETPRIPLLLPEFSVPLFLRMYCESVIGDTSASLAGHQGRVAIFERYLSAKLRVIARRFRPGQQSSYELAKTEALVRDIIYAIVDDIALSDREGISLPRAEEAIANLVADNAQITKMLGILQDEGILTSERLYLAEGAATDGVRIVFQAFSDYLILTRRLSTSELHEGDTISWLGIGTSWGIREAATVVLPERYGVELIDLLSLAADGVSGPAGDDEISQAHRAHQLHRYVVNTLPYREATAITQRTIDLLNDAQSMIRREEFYATLFTLAPIPNSRLNGKKLFDYLARFSMPKRDGDFGTATYDEVGDPSSPAARLARWAAAGPYPSYDPEVVELAAIPLCWLMSSPNRFMRDWVTKALVQLLRGHLDVMERLVRRFWSVNDPYVVQRVIVIAYASYLRSGLGASDTGQRLARTVSELVFTRPVRPDELLIDAARGVVRHGIRLGDLTNDEAQSAARPYGLRLPGSPPTEEALVAKYGWREGQSVTETYSPLVSSVLGHGLGDFGRYVIESGTRNFSRYRIGSPYPERRPRERKFVKRNWKSFVGSLNEDQLKFLNELAATDGMLSSFRRRAPGLTPRQEDLYRSVWRYPKVRDDQYPASRAQRWVLRRAIALGWTPERFGEVDRRISYRNSGREAHKSERWGKKYEWMAYHELLARIADNFQPHRSWFDEPTYDGLQEIIGDREIDPTVPPVHFSDFLERRAEGVSSWQPPPINVEIWPPARLDFGRYGGSLDALIADVTSEPTFEAMLFVRQSAGSVPERDWVVLRADTRQTDPRSPKSWRGLQQIISVNTAFVKRGEAGGALAALSAASRNHVADFGRTRGHVDCCYVREIGKSGPPCSGRASDVDLTRLGDVTIQTMPTTEEYLWESGLYDCSIEEAIQLSLPSTFIQVTAGLAFNDQGPSWVDEDGTTVLTYFDAGDRSSALLVRASFLKHFLSTENLELVASGWFERRVIDGDMFPRVPRPWVESWLHGAVNADLQVIGLSRRRIVGPEEEYD